eukprot:GHVL01000139.1.p1 GENE.GHVL01000139.1~~GHVL01000139.1.p1  ORF type:complete len:297 (+),score=44.94 GHVL01000139.1:71-961(+)
MANRTDPLAATVHGTNPQFLIPKIVRSKIYSTSYWKEHCFALTADTLIDKAAELACLSGTYGGARQPGSFLCLMLKLLQIQPDKDIVVELIKQDQFKYIRALGAFYMRLTGKGVDVYQYLEPLYNDYRKLRFRMPDCKFKIMHMDEFIDDLLLQDTVLDIGMPQLVKRQILEERNELEERKSALEDDFLDLDEEEEEEVPRHSKWMESDRRHRNSSRTRRDSRGRNTEHHRRHSAPRRRSRSGRRRNSTDDIPRRRRDRSDDRRRYRREPSRHKERDRSTDNREHRRPRRGSRDRK